MNANLPEETELDGIGFERSYYMTYEKDNDLYGTLISCGYGTSPVIADTDNDGLLDGYEVSILKTDPLCVETDKDGCSDYHEYIAGTDPLNSASNFSIRYFTNVSHLYGRPMMLLSWNSVAGKIYTVYVKTDPESPFVILKDNITAIGKHTLFFDQGGEPNRLPPPGQDNNFRLYKITVKK